MAWITHWSVFNEVNFYKRYLRYIYMYIHIVIITLIIYTKLINWYDHLPVGRHLYPVRIAYDLSFFQKMNSIVLLDILWIVTCPFNGVVQSIGTYYRCYQNCDLLGVPISDFNHYQSMKKYRCFLYASMQDSKRRRVNLTTSSMVPNPRRYTIQVNILKLDRALLKGVDRGNFECFN